MKNKRFIVLMAIMLTIFSIVTGCGSSNTTGSSNPTSEGKDEYNGLLDIYKGIDPLDAKTSLRYAGGVGFQLSTPLYIAWKTGGLDMTGIDLEYYPTATGPLSVEALTAGEVDFFGSGIGGIAVGCASGSAKMLAYINDDSVVQKFYVKKDDPIALAGLNKETGFYGTASDWKGREIYMPAGTTLQYLMGKALGKLGLTLQDVKPLYMNAENINTALFANKGNTWGIWNFLCYNSALQEQGYVPVVEGKSVGINLATAYATNNKIWSDPQKRKALEKVLEIHFATLEWMKADPANMEIAAKLITEWGEAEGTAVKYEENLAYLKETYYYDLKENYEMFTNTVTNKHGEMLKSLDILQDIMDFYIQQGNYTEKDRDFMIKNQKDLFTGEGLEAVMKKKDK